MMKNYKNFLKNMMTNGWSKFYWQIISRFTHLPVYKQNYLHYQN